MKICSDCGRENADEATRCLECGRELVGGELQRTSEERGGMNLVTVSTAFNPADAQLTRSRLDAAGFHAIVTNELSALSMDGYALAAGGIRVQVPEGEAAEAKEFLSSSEPTNE
jgi:DNA-directed RNA polymerase subunit RPC12/RpoP